MRRWVAAAASSAYLAHALVTDRVVDDCYITFRYVRNWVAGAGPVFNPGERVEGYTNFLWTALLALVHRLAPALELLAVAQALALACGVAVIVLATEQAFSRRAEAGVARAFAPLLLALHAPLVVWSTGGLETLLFTLLVFGAALAELRFERSERGAWLAPLLLALATMTRPDGIVFVGALLVARAWPRAGRGSGLRRAALALAPFALVYLPYWIWRWRYYGLPLPNTFYAKVGGGSAQWKRGVGYVVEWARDGGAPLALLALVAVAARWREPWVRLFALFVAGGLVFVVAVGGDSLGLYRFMVPLSPFLALLAQEALLDLGGWFVGVARRGARAAVARAVLAALALVTLGWSARPTLAPMLWPARFGAELAGLRFPDPARSHSYRWFDNYFVDRLKVAGRWLDRHAAPDDWVAASPAGSIGFHMRQPLLDMLGLNDAHIATVAVPTMGSGRAGHEKGDGPYVLSRRPRFILLGNVAVFDHPLDDAEIEQRCQRLKSERELFADPAFHRLYAKKTVEIEAPELATIAPENRHLFRWFTFYERVE